MRRIVLLSILATFFFSCGDKESKKEDLDLLVESKPLTKEKMKNETQFDTATFANGCFWCTEAIFKNLVGVESVLPGYSGGFIKNPAYREVCNGNTGHAEVVQIKFDPTKISYDKLLEVFFETHDPTTLNRQGNDVGTQYRSEIFYHSDDQKVSAEKAIIAGNESGIWEKPIVTKVTLFETFYEAEDYHKNYYDRVGDENSYCTIVITPKVEKFKKKFHELLKS